MAGLVTAGLLGPTPASAAPVQTAHGIPYSSSTGGVTMLCYDATGYSCTTGGYNGTSGQFYENGWTSSQYWAWGSGGTQKHNCTTYAAFKLEQNGVAYPGWTDNANGWANDAWAHGTNVDQTPAVGAIAEWNGGSAGHVAYVEDVTSSFVEFTSDNYGGGTNHFRISYGSNYLPDNYIHFHDMAGSGGGVADGTFIKISGHPEVYRVAGGAPLYVSTWNSFGGSQPTVDVSQDQFNALRQYPADGTFISDVTDGRVYKVAGGAPEYVSAADASQVPGYSSQPIIGEDHWEFANFAHLREFPADGTFISNVDDGRVYKVAGGAAEYVSAADAHQVPGYDTQPITALSGYEFGAYEHLRQLPANGTFICNADDGRCYEVVGGAPLYISAADAGQVPGWASQPVTTLSGYEFSAYDHLRPYPADHEFICDVDNAFCYVTAGGAALYISYAGSTSVPGWGSSSPLRISDWEFSNHLHLRAQPADNTYLAGAQTGRVYRVLSGVAMYLPSWSSVGGPKPTVVIDQAALDNAGAPVPWNGLISSTPTVTVTSPSAIATLSTAVIKWTVPVQASAITSHDVRYQRAAWNGGFGAWSYPSSWQGVTASSVTTTLGLGYEYCIEVRAHDIAGLVSAWSPSRCVSRPLDDRSLAASAGWTRATGTAFYMDTVTTTTQLGRVLTRTGTALDRVGIVATRCAACGEVALYVGSTRVGIINLYGSTTARKQILWLPRFSYRTGTVTLRTLTSAKPIQIDGLLLSRT